MGSGKTTLGRALEARLPGWRYMDLDELIEQRAGLSVSEIFARYGEEHFRRLERDALQECLGLRQTIVGCGGGTPCYADNLARMNRAGTTVLLEASRPRLIARLIEGREKRPKLARLSDDEIAEYVDAELLRRLPFYSGALHRFPSDLLENEQEIEATCREFIARFISPSPTSEQQ